VAADPAGEIAALYRAVAQRMALAIAQKARDYSGRFPTITVSKDS
jgi:ATP-binding protein involved in chromosome partitioning